ncbi:MAG TPA: exodeoxyribonuclease VII small subunit [Candidatus Paceibacterota bacterium]|nr:exodeoxyribonuclease VII small subunit [Candidatus Paceibacterota bacterium]
MKIDKKELTLKEALAKLDVLVSELNSQDVDLEVGLEKFKEGIEIIKFCREQITKAENTFKSLNQELERNKNEGNGNTLV